MLSTKKSRRSLTRDVGKTRVVSTKRSLHRTNKSEMINWDLGPTRVVSTKKSKRWLTRVRRSLLRCWTKTRVVPTKKSRWSITWDMGQTRVGVGKDVATVQVRPMPSIQWHWQVCIIYCLKVVQRHRDSVVSRSFLFSILRISLRKHWNIFTFSQCLKYNNLYTRDLGMSLWQHY